MLTTTNPSETFVNDVHSRLNPSWVREIVRPRSIESLQAGMRHARANNLSISSAGARHAMGGQQFGAGTLHLDLTGLDRILDFDAARGLVEVEAGIMWPQLVSGILAAQGDAPAPWTIAQKQTGADRLTLGGAVSANIHGRGLTMRPFVTDIESVTVVRADGEVVRCDRQENFDLFRLVVGGYGLFGVIYSVTLRLVPRRKMQRIVEIIAIDEVMPAFESRIRDGFVYGDFQYMTDERSPDYLRRGVFACYRPISNDTPMGPNQRELGKDDWRKLIHLSHVDKSAAYQHYTAHYRATSGQIYWSDLMQMSTYIDDYHREIDTATCARVPGSEMITEIYVPRAMLAEFMRDVAADFLRHGVNVIYGTVRLIERDTESFLAWAREPWACVIFNLHVDHTPAGLLDAADAFRRLIDLAMAYHGSYYLTYHKFATPGQVVACHPRFAEFLREKQHHDPETRFRSDWYDHYARQFHNR
ncbi:MAG: hypothetical protein AMXMBFR4_20460 [Candidatus Hydrogenedentota bacterium]